MIHVSSEKVPEPDFEFSQQRQQPGGRVSGDFGGRASGEHRRGHAAVHAPPAGQHLVKRESSSSTDKSGEARSLPLPPRVVSADLGDKDCPPRTSDRLPLHRATQTLSAGSILLLPQ